jgi:hypothetical protein
VSRSWDLEERALGALFGVFYLNMARSSAPMCSSRLCTEAKLRHLAPQASRDIDGLTIRRRLLRNISCLIEHLNGCSIKSPIC